MYCKNCGKKIEDNWNICPYCNNKIRVEARKGNAGETESTNLGVIPVITNRIEKFNFLKFLLLSIVTCGIYSIVVLYRFTEAINSLCDGDEKESPNYIVVFLLGLVTLGIYGLYWIHRQAERLQDIAPKYNCTITTSATSILLWDSFGTFIGVGQFIAWNNMFKNINRIIENYNFGNINLNFSFGQIQKRKQTKMVGIIVGYAFAMIAIPALIWSVSSAIISHKLEQDLINMEDINLPEVGENESPDEKESDDIGAQKNGVDSSEKEAEQSTVDNTKKETEQNATDDNNRNEREIQDKEYYDSTVSFLVQHPGMSENENIKVYGEFRSKDEIYISDGNESLEVKYDQPAYDEAGNKVGIVTTGKVGYVEGVFISAMEPYIQADKIVLTESLPEEAEVEPNTLEDNQPTQDYSFIGVEGTYYDYSNSDMDSNHASISISEINDNTFWFTIYRDGDVIFARNMATITGSNNAIFTGQQYILNFTWSGQAELTITGFSEVEGMCFVNNSYLQVG